MPDEEQITNHFGTIFEIQKYRNLKNTKLVFYSFFSQNN
jgi:hypothetical protein